MTHKQSSVIKNISIIMGLIGTLILGTYATKKYINRLTKTGPVIGIIQTISHPALDQTREGFIKEIKKQHPDKKILFIIQNGEGNVAQLYSIAQILRKKADIIFAIGTQAAQAACNAEKIKPIIFATVTDPQSAGLLKDDNVCGVTDVINYALQAAMIKDLLPSCKKIALAYNPGEINSVTMVTHMKQELKKADLEVIDVGISTESEIVSGISLAARKADAILIPTDNLLVGAMPTVANLAIKARKPLIASDNPSVERAALASAGVDFCSIGTQAGKIYSDLLKGKRPRAIGVIKPDNVRIIINTKTAHQLGLQVSEKLKKSAQLIQ